MTKRVGSIVPAVVTLGLACAGVMLPGQTAAIAEECAAAPKPTAPQGQHWYYHLDRKTQRRCWYLGPQGQAVVRPASKAAKRAQPTSALPAPANAEQADVPVTATIPVAPAAPAPVTAAPAAPVPAATPAPVAAAPVPVAAPVVQPPTSLATPPDDVWKAVSAAMQQRNQSKFEDANKPAVSPSNTVALETPSAPPAITTPSPAPEQPSAFTAMQNPEPPQSQQPAPSPQPLPSAQPVQHANPQPPMVSASQMVSLASVALIGFAVVGLIWQISGMMRRRREAARRDVQRHRVAAPQLAPSMFDMEDRPASSTFDIREVPPLPPMELHQTDRTRELLGKLLRDVEGRRTRQAIAR